MEPEFVISYRGKRYEWTGEYHVPDVGDIYMPSYCGSPERATIEQLWDRNNPSHIRAILRPLPELIQYGGIEWEVVAHRKLQRGDVWYRNEVGAVFPWGISASTGEWPILRPVRILPRSV